MRLDINIWRDRFKLLEECEYKSREYYIPNISFEDGVALYTIILSIGYERDEFKVFEMGSGVGYSTLWILYALEDIPSKYTELTAIEMQYRYSLELMDILNKSGVKKTRYTVISDDSLKILREYDSKLDFIFVDISKSEYPLVLEEAYRKTGDDGILTFHNAFFPPPPKEFIDEAERVGWRVYVIPTRLGIYLLRKD
ncbi:MAG TPA: hypothetical protein EYH44_03130 [Thermoprotei archaeon]|nr:hypothetical protein [Thermoprotei archaeon]